jgi:NAD+ synthase (glutamine-hydrolysing)
MRITLAQINTTVGDFAGNEAKIIEGIEKARSEHSDIVTFPELVIPGYPPEDLLFNADFVKENLRTLDRLVPKTRGILAVVGFVDKDKEGNLFNAAAILFNGKKLSVYHKVKLPNYGVFDEKRYFKAGSKGQLISWGPYVIAVTICEDIWQEDSIVYSKAFQGQASFILNISASPFHAGKNTQREALLKNLAKKAKASVVYHNLVGGQDELVFDGGSMAVSSSGFILASAPLFEESYLTADISLKSKKINVSKAKGFTVLRMPGIPKEIKAKRLNSKSSRLSPEEEVYKALVVGTHDYIRKNGFKKVLIGLSGGIDSALVACIAKDALGNENVIGVTMPSEFNSKETFNDALKIAKNLEIRCLELPITEALNAYHNTLKPAFAGKSHNEAEENMQARIRGNFLMALSNKFGYLVLTTGNKSEMATGYCTLYGDMAGGFAVIKDVPKTLVFKLANYINSSQKKNVIPQSIIDRAPSAELRHNQKDQDSLPPYEALDEFLAEYIDKNKQIGQIKGQAATIAKQMIRLIERSEYKRRQSPPGIKITPRAFGKDRRMPITNRFFS